MSRGLFQFWSLCLNPQVSFKVIGDSTGSEDLPCISWLSPRLAKSRNLLSGLILLLMTQPGCNPWIMSLNSRLSSSDILKPQSHQNSHTGP